MLNISIVVAKFFTRSFLGINHEKNNLVIKFTEYAEDCRMNYLLCISHDSKKLQALYSVTSVRYRLKAYKFIYKIIVCTYEVQV